MCIYIYTYIMLKYILLTTKRFIRYLRCGFYLSQIDNSPLCHTDCFAFNSVFPY